MELFLITESMECKIFRLARFREWILMNHMYARGGYVWQNKDSKRSLVFLEKDWDGGRLPEDLLEEAGLIGTSLSVINKAERAHIAGYVKNGDSFDFVVQIPETFEKKDFFLATDFNNWTDAIGNPSWKLESSTFYPNSLSLSITNEFAFKKKKFCFKFVSEEGQWIEPTSLFPCMQENTYGSKNFLFNYERTGKDVLSFQLIEGPFKKNLQSWINYKPKGEFGYTKTSRGSKFRLFAPRVESVELLIFGEGNEQASKRYPMDPSEDGSWTINLNENCEGSKYKFAIKKISGFENPDQFEKTVVDPYALALCGRDGPSIALSLSKPQKPTNFSPPSIENLVILETHLRDLLAHAPIDLTNDKRLEFRGLTEWLKSEDCYLKKLGVNAIELQPIQEFDSRTKLEYHWGYMPVNFFSPCSVYGSNPENGSVNLEFQELVRTLHQCDLAVIIDVVYNHMGIPLHLSHIDRELYFMTDDAGNLSNHSGCGNDINPHSGATKKIVIDSLVHLIEKFDIDGFRFDLAELIGIELLSEIEVELKKIKPDIILIAEPWSFRGRLPAEINKTHFSLWSDRCRETLFHFVIGQGNASEMIELLKGKMDKQNLFPWQSVNYLESHDDFTFLDRLSHIQETRNILPSEKIINQAKLAMGILLLSPGIPMIASGQDFLKSKKGIQNTYQRGDLNALDYKKLSEADFFHFWTKELISFRLSEHGKLLRPKNFLSDAHYFSLVNPDSSFALIIGSDTEHKTPALLILVNPNDHESEITLPPHCKEKLMKLVIGEKGERIGTMPPINLQVWSLN